MSDYDFPELPSDDELGITDEDREQFEKDFPDDAPEMSDAELSALLGEVPAPKKPPPTHPANEEKMPGVAGEASKPTADPAAAREQASRAVRQAEKNRSKEEKQAAKEQKKAEKEAAKAQKKAEKEAARQTRARAKEDRAAARKAAVEERKGVAEAEASVPGWRGPATLVLLLLCTVFASSRTGIPRPAPANAPDTIFSSARAMATLVEVARMAHPTGSPEHARVRDLVVERLIDLGMEPEIQTTTSVLRPENTRMGSARGLPQERVHSATVRNVIARIPGTASTGTVVVTAHYDSREIAPGAADAGSGVVAILEAVRAVRAGDPLQNDVIVLITDAEELGLLGAAAFVDEHRWMADVDLVLSFEMRGAGGPSIMFETNDQNGFVIEALAEFAPGAFATSLADEVYKRLARDTDFTPFKRAGVQGLNFATIDNGHVYHQTADTPENLSEATLQHHGIHALSALKHFGNADLSEVNAPNRVYISVPGVGIVTYPAIGVHVVSGLVLLAFLLLGGLALRAGARPGGMLGGVGLVLLVGAGSYAVGWVILDRLIPRHAEAGALMGSLLHSEGWYVLGIGAATLALMSLGLSIARRWLTRAEVLVGALALPVLVGIAAGIVAPLAAMTFQWPALSAVSAGLLLVLLGSRADGVIGWVVVLIAAVPVILIFYPLVEVLWIAMSITLAGGLAILVTLLLTLLLPALGVLRRPNVWWAPAGATVIAAAALGIGAFLARPSESRPLPTTLAFAYEHGSGEALWITGPVTEGLALSEEARSWAESRAGGPFTETRDLEGFGYRGGVVPVRRAEVPVADPPLVEVRADSIVGSERNVLLAVRSQIQAEMLGFELSGGTRLRTLNGVALENVDAIRRANHWGVPEDAVLLELTMPADEAIGVTVLEHLLRPTELLGSEAFARPADMAPNVNRQSDRAMLRYSVAAFVDPRHAFLRPTGRPDTGVPVDSVEVSTQQVEDSIMADTVVSDTLVADTVTTADTTGVTIDTTGVVPDTTLSTAPSGGSR